MGRFLSKLLLSLLLVAAVDRSAGAILKFGLDRYFGVDDSAEILLVGHSHTMLGIDARLLMQTLGIPVAKYAVNGANVFDRLAMLRHFLSENPDRIKLIVYDVDDRAFTGEGMSSNSYRLFYPYIDNSEMQRYLRENAGTYEEFFCRKHLWSLRFNTIDLNLALRGLMGMHDNFKAGRIDVENLQADIQGGRQVGIGFDRDYLAAFEETVRFVRSKNINLVFCYVPTIDLLSRMDPPGHNKVVDIFRNYEKKDSGVRYLDFQDKFSSRYELFADGVHLNREGKKQFTAELASQLREIYTRK